MRFYSYSFNMDLNRIRDDEYELQYFGFSSTAFLQQLHELTTEIIKVLLDELKSGIIQELGHENWEAYQAEFDALFMEFKAIGEKFIRNIEEDVRKYFAIPKNVLLPSDKGRDKQFTNEDIKKMKSEINELENVYIKKKMFVYLCGKELEILQTLDPIQERVNQLLEKADKMKRNKTDEFVDIFKMVNLCKKWFFMDDESLSKYRYNKEE